MALIDLEITKNWDNLSRTRETNWDNIRVPVIEWADRTNRNLEQLSRDTFGLNYEYDNDGIMNRSTSFLDSVLLRDGDEHPTGTWTFDAITSAVVTTADINGGTIDAAPIGGTTPADGIFSTLEGTTVVTRYLQIPGAGFKAAAGVYTTNSDHISANGWLQNNIGTFASINFVAPICLPHGATVTILRFYYYRDDAAASMTCSLVRSDMAATLVTMANGTASAETGDGYEQDQTITSATIDNQNYSYYIVVAIDNNNNIADQYLYAAQVWYTMVINV